MKVIEGATLAVFFDDADGFISMQMVLLQFLNLQ